MAQSFSCAQEHLSDIDQSKPADRAFKTALRGLRIIDDVEREHCSSARIAIFGSAAYRFRAELNDVPS